MNDSISFRKINQIEWNIITNSLSKFSIKNIEFLEKKEFELFIELNNPNSRNSFLTVYLIPEELTEVIRMIPLKISIKHSGLYFGMIKKGQFFLSLEGAEFLNSIGFFPNENKITVNNEGEKSILYGNHILYKDILKIPPDLIKDNFLLIFNDFNELIALAISKVNFLESKNLRPNEIIAFNLIDKGYYLREKQ